jgi:hypothetical protein
MKTLCGPPSHSIPADPRYEAQPYAAQQTVEGKGDGPQLEFAQLENVLFRLKDVKHHKSVEVESGRVFGLTKLNMHAHPDDFKTKIKQALVAINSNFPTEEEQGKQSFGQEPFVAWWAARQQVQQLIGWCGNVAGNPT